MNGLGKIAIAVPLLTALSMLVVACAWSDVFAFAFAQVMYLRPGSRSYDAWLNLPVPIYMEFYAFNWLNANEFEKDPKGIKPRIEEIGPFVFEEVHGRVDVSWSPDGSVMAFNQTRTWRFLPDESADISAPVTNINCLAVTIAYMSKSWDSDLYRKIADALLKRFEPELFVTAPARDWLFDGIDRELLDTIKVLRNLTHIPIPYDKFGWMYDRNESSAYDGRFEVLTGKYDVHEMGNVVRWNGMSRTHYYRDECGVVRGTTGEIMPPMKDFQPRITTFSPDLCSYMSLNFGGETVVEGVPGHVYCGDDSVFDNGDNFPENKCFGTDRQLPSGARCVETCKYGSPAFVSFPHFLLGDPSYRDAVEGFAPNDSEHNFRIKIEPRSGVPLELHAGIQINFLLESIPWCEMFSDMPTLYVPQIWFRQRARITPELARTLKSLLFVWDHGGVILLGVASSTLVAVVVVAATFAFKTNGQTR